MEKCCTKAKHFVQHFFGIGKAPDRGAVDCNQGSGAFTDREAPYRCLSTASVMSCVPTFVQPVSAR